MTNARCRPERKCRRTAGPRVPRGTQGALSYGEAVFFCKSRLAGVRQRRTGRGKRYAAIPASRWRSRGVRAKASGMSLENNMPLTAERIRRRVFSTVDFPIPDPMPGSENLWGGERSGCAALFSPRGGFRRDENLGRPLPRPVIGNGPRQPQC